MDGISVLREAIATIPVPAAPPRLSMDGASVGLGFLDAALRLNHVRRLTERLTVTQHRLAQRSTEVDISINMLTNTQLQAASTFQTLARHSSFDPMPESQSDATVWVPVARLSRTSVGPVEVHDSSGSRLPRLTQYETSRLIASGLYRLLRGILVSIPEARDADSELCKLLFRVHEPRWLLQSAILTVLTEGSKPQTEIETGGYEDRIRDAMADPYRKIALSVIDEYRTVLDDYAQLFDVAINDYIVVVALDGRFDEHLIAYESPLYTNDPGRWTDRVLRLIRASRQGYYVNYRTDIPTTLRSYHLVAEAGDGVDVSRIFLTTNAHEGEVNTLASDLRVVADKLEHQESDPLDEPTARVLELQLEALLLRLAELTRRIRWEASSAKVQPPRKCTAACVQLAQALNDHQIRAHRGWQPGQTLLSQQAISPPNLRAAADEVDKYEFQYDIAVETQPTSSHAHVYWRRPPSGPLSDGSTHIRAGMLLRSTAETSTRLVLIYALGVAWITYLVACFLVRSLWPYGSASDYAYSALASPEAIITILLLVPGFLYTHLSLPSRHSVAGHLRAVPRMVAYLSIASVVTLTADVAAGGAGWVTRLVFILGAAIPLASTLLLVVLGSQPVRMAQTLARLGAPPWVTFEDAGDVGHIAPDVRFSSSRNDNG